MKDVIKDTDEQPDEEIHKVRSGRILNTGASVSVELGCVTLPGWMYLPSWKLPKSYTFGMLWRLPHISMINH